MRAADKGTLFLDEIADLPAAAQAALLRSLQESEVLPVGATRPIKVDVRVLAATHFDLQKQVAEGTFRADLFARISGFTVRLPPLRNRPEDVGLLVGEMIRRHGRTGSDEVAFTTEAARALFQHRWPLNVRELEKCIAAALVLSGGEPIELQHLPEWARAPAPGLPFTEIGPDSEEDLPDPHPPSGRAASAEDPAAPRGADCTPPGASRQHFPDCPSDGEGAHAGAALVEAVRPRRRVLPRLMERLS